MPASYLVSPDATQDPPQFRPLFQTISVSNVSRDLFIERCPDPSESTNAILKGNHFYHGKKVVFARSKDVLLTPETSSELICEYGTWSGIIPTCKGTKIMSNKFMQPYI